MSAAILLTAFAFFGFDAPTVMAGEVRNAPRSVPFAILLSVGSVVVLYTLIQIVCVGTLPDLAASERPLADGAVAFVGPWGAIGIALAAVIACAGVCGASMTAATRLLFAMADHGQLPAALVRVHSRFHTPVLAIVVTAAAALILALSGSFIYLVKLTLIARISVYAIHMRGAARISAKRERAGSIVRFQPVKLWRIRAQSCASFPYQQLDAGPARRGAWL
jgi:amino acid transporter